MSESCMHSGRVTPNIRAALRRTAICPKCGKPRALRPDLDHAMNLLACGSSMAVGSMVGRGSWAAAMLMFGVGFILYLVLGFLLVRLVPLSHVSATDAVASRYRVLITLMLVFCAVVITVAIF